MPWFRQDKHVHRSYADLVDLALNRAKKVRKAGQRPNYEAIARSVCDDHEQSPRLARRLARDIEHAE